MSDDNAAFTIDLSGGPEETPGGKAGRVIGGLLLMLLGVVIVVASVAAFIASAFVPGVADWWDWIADGLFFVGIIGVVIALAGFAIMRRSSTKRRAAEAAEAAAVMEKLKTAGVYDGTATPQTIASAMGEPFDEDASGMQPTKPPISGPTIT
jgi:hypothetical protein